MVVTLFVLLLFGFPVGFTLGGVALLFGYIGLDESYFNLLPQRIWGIMTNYTLLAVPLFILMGVTLERSGIAERLLVTLGRACGRFRGGLAIAVVVAGALLAASTGIVGASVVTMGLISLPVMLQRGYGARFSSGLICASGTLGQIIPPSIVLILLGDIIGVSVGELFIAAVIPGLLLVVGFILYALWFAYRNGEILSAGTDEAPPSTGELLSALVAPGLLITAVLGAIFFGIASPTEAAAVGASGALLLALSYRKLSLKQLFEVTDTSVLLSCMVFTILVGATAFGLVFRGLDGDVIVTDYITELPNSELWFTVLVMLLLFVLGCFLDFIEIVFIVVPLIVPVLHELDLNPLWFGIVIALNLQTSFLTPPLGFALFYLKGVAPPGVKTRDIYLGIIPFVLIQVAVLLFVVLFPDIVLYLPELIKSL